MERARLKLWTKGLISTILAAPAEHLFRDRHFAGSIRVPPLMEVGVSLSPAYT